MPFAIYRDFIDKCDQSSREYAILKNGVIVHSDNPGDIVQILCALEEANKLLSHAAVVYPDAVGDIAKAIMPALKAST